VHFFASTAAFAIPDPWRKPKNALALVGPEAPRQSGAEDRPYDLAVRHNVTKKVEAVYVHQHKSGRYDIKRQAKRWPPFRDAGSCSGQRAYPTRIEFSDVKESSFLVPTMRVHSQVPDRA
jgi:hypothetical protein